MSSDSASPSIRSLLRRHHQSQQTGGSTFREGLEDVSEGEEDQEDRHPHRGHSSRGTGSQWGRGHDLPGQSQRGGAQSSQRADSLLGPRPEASGPSRRGNPRSSRQDDRAGPSSAVPHSTLSHRSGHRGTHGASQQSQHAADGNQAAGPIGWAPGPFPGGQGYPVLPNGAQFGAVPGMPPLVIQGQRQHNRRSSRRTYSGIGAPGVPGAPGGGIGGMNVPPGPQMGMRPIRGAPLMGMAAGPMGGGPAGGMGPMGGAGFPQAPGMGVNPGAGSNPQQGPVGGMPAGGAPLGASGPRRTNPTMGGIPGSGMGGQMGGSAGGAGGASGIPSHRRPGGNGGGRYG